MQPDSYYHKTSFAVLKKQTIDWGYWGGGYLVKRDCLAQVDLYVTQIQSWQSTRMPIHSLSLFEKNMKMLWDMSTHYKDELSFYLIHPVGRVVTVSYSSRWISSCELFSYPVP